MESSSLKILLSPLIRVLSYIVKLSKSKLEKDLYWYEKLSKIYQIKLQDDFDSIYVATLYKLLIEREKKRDIIRIFEIEEVKNEFKNSIYKGDDSSFNLSIDDNVHTNPKLRKLKDLDLDVLEELSDFRKTFKTVVNETRRPKELESEDRANKIENKLNIIDIGIQQLSHNEKQYFEDLKVPDELRGRKAVSEALKFYDKLIKEKFDIGNNLFKYKLLVSKGFCLLDLIRNKEAAKLFIEALQYNPDSDRALAFASLGYFLLKRGDDAEIYAQKSLERNPLNENAYSTLINVWSNKMPFDEIEGKLPEEIKDGKDISYQMGRIYYLNGDLKNAERWHRRALVKRNDRDEDIIGALGSLIIEQSLNPFHYVTNQLDDTALEHIKEGRDFLLEAWEKVKQTDLAKSRVVWLINISIADKILNDPENALYNLKRAYEIAPDDFDVVKRLAIGYFDMGRYDDAYDKIQECQNIKNEEELSVFEAEIQYAKYDFKGCLNTIEKLDFNKLEKRTHQELSFLKIACYSSSKNHEEALKFCDQLLADKEYVLRAYLTKSRIYKSIGDYEGFKDYLDKAITSADDNTSVENLHDLVSLMAQDNRHKQSIEFLEKIVNRTVYSKQSQLLIECLIEAGKLNDALELINSLKAKNENEFLIDAEFRIYHQIHDYPKAIELCEQYLEKKPNNAIVKLRLATIFSLQGDIDLLKPLVLSIDDFEDQSLDFKIQLCAFIIQCKQSLKAIEILYQVRRENYSNGRIHLAYFQLFIKVEEEIVQKFLDKEIVEFDTTVKLHNSDNDQTTSKTVLKSSDVRSYQNEIGLDHQMTSDLLGKKIGDKVYDSNGVSLEIVGIAHKYLTAQHESMQLLENQFQDISGFQSFKLKRAPGEKPDFERDLAPMLKKIDEDRSFFDQLENQYENGLPLGTFASFSKRNPIKVWSHFIQLGSPGIHHFRNSQEHNYGISLITSGVDLAFSSSAILSSYAVMKEKLPLIKNNFIVSQSFINELNELITELGESFQKGGYLTVGKKNGKYFRENITSEQLENNVQYYSDLKKWVEENFIIQPNYDEIKIEKGEKDRLDGLFGESFIDAAFIAKAKKGLLIDDDANFRGIVKQEYNINGVSIYSLIRSFSDQNLISKDEESRILYDLACINYNLIPPSVQLLNYALNELKFQLKFPLTNLLDSLGTEIFEVNISIVILVQFLKQVYLVAGDLVFQKVADYVIKVVMRRNPYPQAKMIFFSLAETHFKLLVLQRQTLYSIWKNYEII
ncbi:tetratricopeptide repeat protein [Algoriphagus aquimarinus]|uniref:Tetratricopeptide repeat protein n=1 Tax=Algoriphagus aquimarinus TaxID=237018 RepID=A0A5C7AZ63_9BACT|nr:hypothetical protein [Algoriphagus aquimarinus]TXE13487.1 hypothetical protein ESV85_05800 [Algoriphagus aquimarinus]